MDSWSTKHLGERLREERKRLGITQGDAALLVGVRREQWSHYESGAAPSSDVLVRLLGASFDLNYILGGTRTATEDPLTDQEGALLTDYRDTDDAGRAAIARTAALEASRARGAVLLPQPKLKKGGITNHGDVGQAAERDLHNLAPLSVAGKPRKKRPAGPR